MTLLVKMLFGSHVYGTNTPESDTDYKGVYVPALEDFYLGRVRDSINYSTKSDGTQKNSKDDIDFEIFSIRKYLSLLLAGQTVALDMLFTPQEFWVEFNPAWEIIIENRSAFLSKRAQSFVGYCREQANKYGIKGSRMNAVMQVLDYTTELPNNMTVGDINWCPLLGEHIVICLPTEKVNESYLEVCNRKVSYSLPIKEARKIWDKIYQNYGNRSKQAALNEGVDFKALSHAVRVIEEAKELFTTGNITFPLINKDLILKIKTKQMPYTQVAEIIEQGLAEVEEASKNSFLPDDPNVQLAEQIILFLTALLAKQTREENI